MADQVIAYEVRTKDKQSTLTNLRAKGMVPGIVYGANKEPDLVSIDNRDIFKHLRQGGFFSNIFELKNSGSGESIRVLPRDVQMHPVKDTPLHVDFLRVSDQTILKVSVPVHFINENASPGLKSGGVLTIVRHEVELVGKLGAMPSALEVDLTGFEIGDAIKISVVTLPKGITPTITNRDFTIANIAVPRVQEIVSDTSADAETDAEEGTEE